MTLRTAILWPPREATMVRPLPGAVAQWRDLSAPMTELEKLGNLMRARWLEGGKR